MEVWTRGSKILQPSLLPRVRARKGRKLREYFEVGVDAVSIVEPSNRAVQVYRGIDEVQTLEEDDVLESDGPLGGFSVAGTELFGG